VNKAFSSKFAFLNPGAPCGHIHVSQQDFCCLDLYLTPCLLFHCTALSSQDRHKTYTACPTTGNMLNVQEINIFKSFQYSSNWHVEPVLTLKSFALWTECVKGFVWFVQETVIISLHSITWLILVVMRHGEFLVKLELQFYSWTPCLERQTFMSKLYF
jgi:hypothetical protein